MPNTPSSDEELVAAARAGSADAIEALLEKYQQRIFGFGLRMCGDAEDAKEVLQETLLAAARNVKDFRGGSSLSTWLYTIARSKLVDHWRRHEDAVSLDEAANDPGGESPLEIDAGDAQRPDVQAISREQARAFIDAVEQLPPVQREAFLLQAEGGLSLEEIAAVTSAGHETVKSRLRYAMAKLRSAMEAWQ